MLTGTNTLAYYSPESITHVLTKPLKWFIVEVSEGPIKFKTFFLEAAQDPGNDLFVTNLIQLVFSVLLVQQYFVQFCLLLQSVISVLFLSRGKKLNVKGRF